MPERVIRWRTADGRSGQFTAAGPSARRSRPTAAARPARPARPRSIRAVQSPPPPSGLDVLRARLGLPATATDEQVVEAATARLGPAPAAQGAPAPAPASAPLPLVSASGPTAADLAEEARWEEANARLFGLPTGPATTALAAAGLPSPAEARSDAYAAAQQAQDEAFSRAAEADRLAQVRDVDAARGGRAQASAEDRALRERAQDAALFPELGR